MKKKIVYISTEMSQEVGDHKTHLGIGIMEWRSFYSEQLCI